MKRPQYRIVAVPDGDDADRWTVQLSIVRLWGTARETLIDTWEGPELDPLLHCARIRIRTCEAARILAINGVPE